MEDSNKFEWRIGRLDDPHMTSLRYFAPPIQNRRSMRDTLLIVLFFILISFAYSIKFGLLLLSLPIVVGLYSGIMQHLLFRDVVNKKFNHRWYVMAVVIEKVLKRKEIPFERTDFDRKITFQLDDDLMITITPCQSYIHPRTQALRWMIHSKGRVSDVSLRPLTPETYPLIDSLTLKLEAELTAPPETAVLQNASL